MRTRCWIVFGFLQLSGLHAQDLQEVMVTASRLYDGQENRDSLPSIPGSNGRPAFPSIAESDPALDTYCAAWRLCATFPSAAFQPPIHASCGKVCPSIRLLLGWRISVLFPDMHLVTFPLVKDRHWACRGRMPPAECCIFRMNLPIYRMADASFRSGKLWVTGHRMFQQHGDPEHGSTDCNGDAPRQITISSI